MDLFHLLDAAELAQRVAPGLGGSSPRADRIALGELEMRADLVVQLALEARAIRTARATRAKRV